MIVQHALNFIPALLAKQLNISKRKRHGADGAGWEAGAVGGMGRCLARRYATNCWISASVRESEKGGIFWPPLRIW
jgi:hypothetical protein